MLGTDMSSNCVVQRVRLDVGTNECGAAEEQFTRGILHKPDAMFATVDIAISGLFLISMAFTGTNY